MFLGCHLTISKGFLSMGQEAIKLGANTLQFFTRNPRGSRAKELVDSDVAGFLSLSQEQGFGPIVAHAPYTLNPAAFEPRIASLAKTILTDDFKRLSQLPGVLYNLHPGSHLGHGPEAGMDQTMDLLNAVYPEDGQTVILLETMAGKGNEIGRNFEELAYMVGKFKFPEKIGVCLDTCHIHDGGYDIVGDLDGVLADFDRTVGLNKLLAIHLNDSLNPLNSHKDRHAKIGEGTIGLKALVKIITHPKLSGRPIILETPNDLPGYEREIKLLKKEAGLNGKAT
jgi:deoxyribonuclease-4